MRRFASLLCLLLAALLSACGSSPPPAAAVVPTPDVEATVSARLTAIAPTAAPTQPPKPTAAAATSCKLNAVCQTGPIGIAVAGPLMRLDSLNPAIPAQSGKQYIVTAVSVENDAASGTLLVSPVSFRLRDTAGMEWPTTLEPVNLPGNNIPPFLASNLAPGKAAQGMIAFQIPTSVSAAAIVFQSPQAPGGEIVVEAHD